MDDEIKKRRKDGWIEAWFAVETLAVDKDTTESALKNHVEKLTKAKDTFVYETKFSPADRIENPLPNVKEGHSQVVELKLFVKDIYTLINVVMLYGPSSIEILGPVKKEAKLDELQSLCNLVSGVLHQFAAQGAGGIVISPGK